MRAKEAVGDGAADPIKVKVEDEYRRRTQKSAHLHELAMRVMPGGDTRTATYHPPYPVFVDSAAGCRLTDVDGNVYIDFVGNYTSMIHGHAHPQIVEAVIHQLKKGTNYAAPLELQIKLANHLRARIPSVEQIRFCNSGTEATMFAIRAAKAFTGRNKVLKMEGGYHGTHDAAAISVAPPLEIAGPDHNPSSVPDTKGLFRGVVSDIIVAPFNDIGATKQIIEHHQSDLSAVIVEPVLGAGGMIPAHPDYLHFLRQATRACGALLIFDEVISFRLSYGGAQEIYHIDPDLTALGKTIGGGFPVGAFGGRADVMALFDPRHKELSHSGTFNGNAVTMTAGVVAMELLTREEIARINQLGDLLRQALRECLSKTTMSGQVTGTGSLAAWHFTRIPPSNYRDIARASKSPLPLLHLALMNRGIFTAPRGFVSVSTAMRKSEIDELARSYRDVLVELELTSEILS